MISLEVRLPDTPGTLIQLIEPISKNGGNIYSILHYHDKKLNNMIPVEVTFEISDELRDISLKKIQNELSEKDIPIDKITLGTKQKRLVVLLSGHVFDTDVLDTIKRLAAKGVKTLELQAKFTELEEISNVKLKLGIPESITEKELIKELNKICEEKDLSLIRG
jgi:ACT domain-containing protein